MDTRLLSAPPAAFAHEKEAYEVLLSDLRAARETVWCNPQKTSSAEALAHISLTRADVDDAEARLARFAPFLAKAFPETAADGGLIESPLTEIGTMRNALNARGAALAGRLFLKRDSDLPIAGSVKARGGIYEVLKHSEELAIAAGLHGACRSCCLGDRRPPCPPAGARNILQYPPLRTRDAAERISLLTKRSGQTRI